MKKYLFAFITCALGLLPLSASAQEVAPDVLVQNVTTEVLDIVAKDKDIQSGNVKKAAQLIEVKVLPHFDFQRMTALAVGKDWRAANPTQQATLANEFKILLVRTYANAFTSYKNQKVEFKPLRAAPTDTEVTVKTQFLQPNGKPVQIDYTLKKQPAGWKVYDVAVAGVSLVSNYRNEFGTAVSNGGIDNLIKLLQDKNSKNALK